MTDNKDTNATDSYPSEFKDIAPYTDSQYNTKIKQLAGEPGFEHALRFIMPDVDYPELVDKFNSVDNLDDFQRKIAGPVLEYLAKRTTAGVSISGMENVKDNVSCTFISNHRDIVLDASFLNLCFIREHKPITQIAIGNNLLIYDWIKDLVRLNRCFIVKRDVRPLQALAAARELSSYIHYTVNCRHESVWIAQREGRAKDSNDITQESLLKMLTLGCEKDTRESLMQLNILPVSISYEYDPNDYLKVKEFLLRRRDPDFKKSQHDDLFSMETGILKFKGHVHFTINTPVNNVLGKCEATDRNTVIHTVREAIDNEIHRGYRIFPINYIAYDKLNDTDRFASFYNAEQENEVSEYFERQEARIDVSDITAEERSYIREMFLTMYANPLINKMEAETKK